MPRKEERALLDFIAEAGVLKRVRRSGWWVLGIKDVETVAEHSFRCTVIGYILAHLEGASLEKVLILTVFNDIHEARLNDLHKMSQRYFDAERAEDKAYNEQVSLLPKKIKKELLMLHKEYRLQKTKASIVARDADILECLIQAKEYEEHGYKEAFKFMKKAPRFLRTKSAKRLWKMARSSSMNKWWEALSDFKR